MIGFTKERIEQFIKNPLEHGLTRSEQMEMARQLLTSMEQEPVAFIDRANLDYLESGADADVWPASRTEMGDVILYRSAPPAPVSVPDEANPENIEILASTLAPCGVTYQWDRDECNAAADSWNACRAAMLQSFGNSEQLNSPVIPDGWVACSELMPEQFKAILAFNEYGEVWSGAYDRYWNFYCDNLLVEHVTHWMPLPAAPQQEA
ncbi:DUF551 domain-containing protein [Enterobacter kobei]|uniref:DUF551 domain-containing protein n=1 Tax=Enterobacter kobei TaxID=208224 RepID=UPI002174DBAC|nr:DUF551 domain-containing protein [Enterobacter kobei]MCS4608099.1 DUF551 domain-containing protein [Enterobacter kobei]